jgi:hypothetical protein
MANAELMAKANEKRMNALEKKLDAFEKDFRKNGDMSTILKRLITLEAAVKALAVTAKSAGATDSRVEAEIKNMKDRVAEREKEIDRIEKSRDPNADKKIADLEKRKDVLEKTIVAINGRTDREAKAAEAKIEKLSREADKEQAKVDAELKRLTEQAKKFTETTVMEARLKNIEAMVQAALAKR